MPLAYPTFMSKPLSHKALIVDDNEFDRFIHQKLLNHHKIAEEVFTCRGGREALEWLQEKDKPVPDLILLDIMMPEMDGFEFLTHYDGILPRLSLEPALFLVSSSEDEQDLKRARKNPHVLRMLHKPLSPDTLIKHLKTHQGA